MSATINFVFKGKDLVIPSTNCLSLTFNKIFQPNQIYKLPSGKERKMDYGYAEISSEIEEIGVGNFLKEQISLIKENLDSIKDMGLEEIILYMTFEYKDQFNWEFTPTLLGQLNELNITLAISAYKED